MAVFQMVVTVASGLGFLNEMHLLCPILAKILSAIFPTAKASNPIPLSNFIQIQKSDAAGSSIFCGTPENSSTLSPLVVEQNGLWSFVTIALPNLNHYFNRHVCPSMFPYVRTYVTKFFLLNPNHTKVFGQSIYQGGAESVQVGN